MLSIGKLAAGQADYYLQQARARVDAVTSISSGLEDYYFDGPEASGSGSALERVRLVCGEPWAWAGSVVCSRAWIRTTTVRCLRVRAQSVYPGPT
jgi:hypothetical protein